MYKLICVSNRHIFYDVFGKNASFESRIRDILSCGIDVILREKDLDEEEYYALLCRIGDSRVIAHTYADAARRFGCSAVHLPLGILRSGNVSDISSVGSSVHSAAEAQEAEALGADHITAGHVFATDCKKGLEPRGLRFISEVSAAVKIPVYAIGGISPENAPEPVAAGAAGVCVMSGFMRCVSPRDYIDTFKGYKSTRRSI